MKCSKCGGQMIEGGLFDARTSPIGFIEKGKNTILRWFKNPSNTFSYLCTECGYIETYLKNK